MKFQCPNCSQKLTAKDNMAGWIRTCPKCKRKIAVPEAPDSETPSKGVRDAGPPSPTATLDGELFDHAPAARQIDRIQGLARRQEEAWASARPSPDHTGERQVAWPLDVLLYPANVSGAIHLVIFSFLMAQLRPALQANYWLGPPIMHLALLVIGGGYCLFYLAGCLRDSAGDGFRAPDVNQLPERLSIDAILSQLFSIFAWTVFCVGPLLACIIIGRTDYPLWLSMAYAVVYAPIALLAVVMFDSVRALSPLLILPSILSVLGPYLLLVLSSCLIAGLCLLLYWRIALGSVLCAYLLMVMAHVVGRFYRRYEDRLNWEA